ncbi:MAG: hypothetical protein B7Y98_10525 [Sphingomonas sp. 32-62-10]|nr:MAG: hypothetical protein B7Y98_10525 [Sphingomonas sp. 32-62-10]
MISGGTSIASAYQRQPSRQLRHVLIQRRNPGTPSNMSAVRIAARPGPKAEARKSTLLNPGQPDLVSEASHQRLQVQTKVNAKKIRMAALEDMA